MLKPTVSVITVCYNCANELEQTIISVLNQTYPNLEYIIIDGGSTDGTSIVLEKYSNRISKIVSEPDKGVYDAMNKGIDLATGEWINFMNAGDFFADNDAVEVFFNRADTSEGNDILYGDTILRFHCGTYYLNAEKGNWFHQSIFTRTSVMRKFKFDIRYKIVADNDFLIKAQKAGSKMVYVPRVVSNYDHCYGLSSTKNKIMFLERSEIYNVSKNFSWYIKLCVINIKEFIDDIFRIRQLSIYKRYIERKQCRRIESNPLLRRIS